MRDYLNDIEIVGATMVYSEGEVCRWSLDWLYKNCDRVCILLDNWDEKTEKIILEYKEKYPDITNIVYSKFPVQDIDNNRGRIKQRFNRHQHHIREELVKELKVMNTKKGIDLLIWPDSDETFIDCFPEYLEEFWREQTAHSFMMLGFVEVYDKFNVIVSQKMGPHGRVFKYKENFTCIPKRSRTVQNPYYGTRPWKIRNMIVHMCNFNNESRDRRQYTSGRDMMTEMNMDRFAWILPKDVRKMRPNEISRYQPSPKGNKAEIDPILLKDYIKKK